MKENKVEYIYNWMDESLFSDDVKYNIESKQIITVARVEKVKGIENIIKVSKRLKEKYNDWQWHIYGGGEQSYIDELENFAECGLCGTAAVISPVGKVVDHGKEICFPSGMSDMGPITKKLYETLTGITTQMVYGSPKFVKAYDMFVKWCESYGADYEIYAWSETDYKQVLAEMELKQYAGKDKFLSFDKWFDFQREFMDKMELEHIMSLEKALNYACVEYKGHMHDALCDAKNTAELFEDDEKKSDEEINNDSYDRKDEAEKDADNKIENQTNDNGKTIANVSISSAGALSDKVLASGMVSNIIEEGGSCTYAFTNGETTFTETTTGIANAKNTVCSSVTLDKNQFTEGVWEVTLQYESTTSEGQSEATTFEIR